MSIASRLIGPATLLICTSLLFGCGGGGEGGSSSSSSGSSSSSSSSTSSSGMPTGGIKVLPIGGSTTQGIIRHSLGSYSLSGGYRPHLFEMALNDGKLLTFVGAMSDGPDTVAGQPFPKNHHGHPGWMVSDFSDIVPVPALSENPDIILLAVGMEDMSTTDAGNAAGDVVELVREIVSNQPNAVIVLLPLPDDLAQPEEVSKFNLAILNLAKESSSDKIIISGIDWTTLTYPHYPSDAWYRAIARSWYDAIKPYL